MDFATQYTQTLTVESTSSEHILSPTYFAGVFYDPLDSTLDRLPTVLSGGRIEISDPLSLSYQPLDCRMLLYIEEGGGLLHLRGTEHMLTPGTLLYLDRRSASFTLTIDQSSSRFIVFSLVGGAFYRLRISGSISDHADYISQQLFSRPAEPETAPRR